MDGKYGEKYVIWKMDRKYGENYVMWKMDGKCGENYVMRKKVMSRMTFDKWRTLKHMLLILSLLIEIRYFICFSLL
jgi:hypothetical protein